jgi:hypothetical protein
VTEGGIEVLSKLLGKVREVRIDGKNHTLFSVRATRANTKPVRFSLVLDFVTSLAVNGLLTPLGGDSGHPRCFHYIPAEGFKQGQEW